MIERRHLAIEVRADTAGRKLAGYAATFGTPADIGGFTETIRSGAFRASLASKGDVAALIDHNPEKLLARTRSGTLKLNEDGRGLAFEISVPDTSVGRDVLELASRGDLGGMSFGFTDPVDEWRDRQHRELRSLRLVEISVITGGQPAYPSTSVAARSITGRRLSVLTPAARRRLVEWL
jgi:HK97 family phage prohead protease